MISNGLIRMSTELIKALVPQLIFSNHILLRFSAFDDDDDDTI